MNDPNFQPKPMPTKFGVGFMSQVPLPEDLAKGYRLEVVGNFHNYHATVENWNSFVPPITRHSLVIDGFSPNMNKELHVGHLRNLAIAKSLSSFLPSAKFVAILGCTLGVLKSAQEGWKNWTNFVGYKPQVYHDVTLPQDVIEVHTPTDKEIWAMLPKFEESSERLIEAEKWKGTTIWKGPKGPVIVKRTDGRPLYAFYDLLFAKEVGPTHYITGYEQKEHFANLGLAEKHLPMGLVLGTDGKKLKSRDGNALLADDAMKMVVAALSLEDVFNSRQIAWNILAWNFLHAARGTDLKFEVEKWIRPESAGLYITYTYARVLRALNGLVPTMYDFSSENLTEGDVKLLALSEQYLFYQAQAINKIDPAPIANYAHDLARVIGAAYESETIRNGRTEFVHVMRHVLWRLSHCMTDLGMFLVQKV